MLEYSILVGRKDTVQGENNKQQEKAWWVTPASWVENSPPDLSQGSSSKTLICDPTMKYKFQLGRTFRKLGGYLEFVRNWTQWPGQFGLTETRILNRKEIKGFREQAGLQIVNRDFSEFWQGIAGDRFLIWDSGRSSHRTIFVWKIIFVSYFCYSSPEWCLWSLFFRRKNTPLLNYGNNELFFSIRSVAQSRLTPCNPMNRGTPGLPVHHQHL